MPDPIRVSFRLLAPLCHGSFGTVNTGNAVVIRREPIVSLPGMPRVPVVSGNSIRGQARRHVMRDLFARAGLGVGDLPGRQWDMLYGALANGGHLTGNEKSPAPEEIRDLRESLPPLSVFGAALYRWMLPGKMQVGFAWPVCLETITAGLVDDPSSDLVPAGDIVTETGLVRHVERDLQSPETSGVTPMPVTVEALATGTVLECRIGLSASCTPVEIGAVACGLDCITHLGAKGGAGLGAVEVSHDGDVEPYAAWLEETGGEELRRRLTELAAAIS